MFEYIDEQTARIIRQELDRQGYEEERTLHVQGDCSASELCREYFGLLEFELDQLSRVENKRVLIMLSELVGRGVGKYVLYSKYRTDT